MKKSKERPSVTKALMWRITALALGLWLCMMCGITWACAWDVCNQYCDKFNDYVDIISYRAGNFKEKDYYDKDDIQAWIFQQKILLYADDGFPFVNTRACRNPNEYAIVCFDEVDMDGFQGITPCWVDNGNYMYFYYNTNGSYSHYPEFAYVDLDETQFGREIIAESRRWGQEYTCGLPYPDDHAYDRLTGWFEGTKFHLVEAAKYDEYRALTEEPEDEWVTVVDTAEPDKELVHIYPHEITIQRAATKSVFVGGTRNGGVYNNLEDMLINGRYNSRRGIVCTVCSSGIYFTDHSGEDYLLNVAIRVSPLKIAFVGLLGFYVVTLLILAVILLLIHRGIRKKLVRPMQFMLKLVAEDSNYMPEPEEYWWEEAYELYVRPLNAIHEYKKEITQLNTAMDYARDAEENRRLMVSNITHELKTPLAVIHSYAEGLKEGIAADKQDHYLDVILEEAQRMDGMVLEMLDLSRLEAGKVRLATDRFSLLELTKRVIDKLSLLVEEKDLTVEYVWAHDCEITADEGRITQAVTNLVSNAIKYSPRGSTVHIGVTREKNQTMFSIENQSEPLSEEALAKIWDSFYRTDKSRTEKGTGLGLPITKAIIELHGGTCQVCNTTFRQENKSVTGVEFKFYLP